MAQENSGSFLFWWLGFRVLATGGGVPHAIGSLSLWGTTGAAKSQRLVRSLVWLDDGRSCGRVSSRDTIFFVKNNSIVLHNLCQFSVGLPVPVATHGWTCSPLQIACSSTLATLPPLPGTVTRIESTAVPAQDPCHWPTASLLYAVELGRRGR